MTRLVPRNYDRIEELSMRNWDMTKEWLPILDESTIIGVDPYAVATIRIIENGAPGKDFGVLSVPAPTYADQLHITCVSLAHRMSTSMRGGVDIIGNRLCLDDEFIDYFASKWAPIGSDNDPNDKNVRWPINFKEVYKEIISLGGPIKYQEVHS